MGDKSNPWSDEGWSVTGQHLYIREKGQARAAARARDAGTTVGGPMPRLINRETGLAKAAIIRPGERPIYKTAHGHVVPVRKPHNISLVHKPTIGIEQTVVVTQEQELVIAAEIGVLMSVILQAASGDIEFNASMLLGVEQDTTLTVEADFESAMDLGVLMDALISFEAQLVATASIGVEMASSFSNEQYVSASAEIGVNQTVVLDRTQYLTAAPEIGVNQSVTLDRTQLLSASPSVGINQAVTLDRTQTLAASASLGVNQTVVLDREQRLTASASIGITQATTLTRILALAAASSIGITAAVTLTTVASNSYLLGGNNSRIFTAVNADLNSFTSRVNSFSGDTPVATFINSAKTIWLAGGSGGILEQSGDGVTWTSRDIGFPFGVKINGFATDGTTIVAIGDLGHVATSANGITWTSRVSVFTAFNENLNVVKFLNNQFIIITGASTTGRVMSSTNGTTWTSRFNAFDQGGTGLIFDGTTYVASTNGPSNSSTTIWSSTNLTTWTSRFNGFDNNGTRNILAFTGGVYVIGVAASKAIWRSTNITTWTSTATGFPVGTVNCVITVGSTFVACGGFGALGSSTDGITWTSKNSGLYSDAVNINSVSGV